MHKAGPMEPTLAAFAAQSVQGLGTAQCNSSASLLALQARSRSKGAPASIAKPLRLPTASNPNLIEIVVVPKAGTTNMAEYLARFYRGADSWNMWNARSQIFAVRGHPPNGFSLLVVRDPLMRLLAGITEICINHCQSFLAAWQQQIIPLDPSQAPSQEPPWVIEAVEWKRIARTRYTYCVVKPVKPVVKDRNSHGDSKADSKGDSKVDSKVDEPPHAWLFDSRRWWWLVEQYMRHFAADREWNIHTVPQSLYAARTRPDAIIKLESIARDWGVVARGLGLHGANFFNSTRPPVTNFAPPFYDRHARNAHSHHVLSNASSGLSLAGWRLFCSFWGADYDCLGYSLPPECVRNAQRSAR